MPQWTVGADLAVTFFLLHIRENVMALWLEGDVKSECPRMM